MFQLTRRFSTTLPLLWLGIGILGQPLLLPLPALLMLAILTWRHHRILTLVGTAPLASDGFAKHVTVDDLLRLAGQTLLSPLLYAVGASAASALSA